MSEQLPSKSIVLGIPTYDNMLSQGTFTAGLNAFAWGVAHRTNVYVSVSSSSLLAHGFNMLWATACQVKPDYFVMLHADIGVEDDWLGTLIDELERSNADVLSCVVPIKDDHKLTSTAIDYRGDARKLTYAEIEQLPQTFGDEELLQIEPESKGVLLNTGLWIAKHGDWWKKWTGFEIRSGIKWQEDGEYKLLIESEDWRMSRQFRRMGLKLMATSKMAVTHHGWRIWHSPTGIVTHGTSAETQALQVV